MDLQRYAALVEYDGRPWLGWQSQPGGMTVQDQLESALGRLVDHPLRIHCAGRTDTGVHSLGQIIHFDTAVVRQPHAWVRGVNSFLPESVALGWCMPVSSDFHARFSAISRTYHYVLRVAPVRSPHLAGRVGWTHHTLELEPMQVGAQSLVGTHDFTAFRSSECQAKSPIKTVHSAEVLAFGEYYVFTVRANAFLHHMVRNVIGSLIAVGQGKHRPEWMAEVLASRERAQAAATFMPDGLYLATVQYDPSFGLGAPLAIEHVFPGLRGC